MHKKFQRLVLLLRRTLKRILISCSFGRLLYARFRRLRAILSLWLMYAGLKSADELDLLLEQEKITLKEAITALDRIPKRYKLAETMRKLKSWKKYG